jgi:vanillate O-demethylase ferredoxin subunit
VRQYSLCAPVSAAGYYLIGLLRDPRSPAARQACSTACVGQVLTIGLPPNLVPLKACAGHSLLFAGGIGITPILCMARQLARR